MDERVFVIESDSQMRAAVGTALRSAGLAVEAFELAQPFLHRDPHPGPSCVVLDMRLEDMDGLAVQTFVADRRPPVPVVFLSAEPDVRSTARAMRDGAVDCLQKPVDEEQLVDAVARALARARDAVRRFEQQHEIGRRVSHLTTREREVATLVSNGRLNKEIARELGIAEDTVKVHRGRAMRKLGVQSVPALVRLMDSVAR
jgi:FixJ family two-component response regulator